MCPAVRLKSSVACNRAKYERVIAYLPHFGFIRDRVRGPANVIASRVRFCLIDGWSRYAVIDILYLFKYLIA